MPSSPGPSDYKRTIQRFFYRGLSLLPQDALPDGKAVFARNIRSYQDGTFEPRFGLDPLTDLIDDASPLAPIHSIFRLNDTTPFADDERRFLGIGISLYGGTPTWPTVPETYSVVDPNAYSGNPLTGVVAQPVNSPRPFLYIGDSVRSRKVNTSFNDYPIGIPQPILPPVAQLAAPQLTYLDTIGVAAWTTYGGNTAPLAPAAAPVVSRVATNVSELIYDTGGTGMACVSLLDFENVTAGMNLDIGAAPETVIVQEVNPPVSPTTIAAILYDSGTTGLCTIQPTGSFSSGQIEAALPIEIERRYRDLNIPVPPRVTITRPVDFPVNSLIELGGTEVVRILSVAIGPDGVQSFRCLTVNTYTPGNAIIGVPSFRAYFYNTRGIGDPATASAYQVTVTAPTTTDPVVGGVQGPISGPGRNWALVGNRALQPEDIIRVGFKASLLGFVEAVRLVLDVSPVSTSPPSTFLRDYYFYEWRASDLIAAIQATGETATGLIADSQANAVTRGQTTSLYTDQFGQESVIPVRIPGGRLNVNPQTRPTITAPDYTGHTAVPRAGPVSAGTGVARQLALGNDAWMTLECRAGDLTRVGSDTTLTLGDILSAACWAQINGTTTPIDIGFSDAYIIGGYGPDVGTILPPYVYRYSYRSTITGERSNPSPPMRAGVVPRRGRVQLDLTPSGAPQTDVIDLWRFGGSLASWVYVGTTPNDDHASPHVNSFDDDMADRQIDGGERIRPNWYQPWPCDDLPRSGTCNVAGTAIEWDSGDVFNVDWAADSLIIINGIATQLYASPESTTRLTVVDNCGSGSAVPFSLPSPTLLAQSLFALWGGAINSVWFHFACGDPTNPGVLHWSHGNDPDATALENTIVVTSASEPLQNGFIDDGIPYVFSTGRLFRLLPDFTNPLSIFLAVPTNCTRGLWSPWFFCVDPDGGCYFGNKDGIFHTAGGADAIDITTADLQPLFPQDGTDTFAIRNLNPVDFSLINRLRLAIVGDYLYFDYVDVTGEGHTLVFNRITKAWTADAYLESTDSPPIPTGVTVRLSEPGPQVYDHIVALEDGRLYQYSSLKITDDLAAINWAYWTPWATGDDPRAFKQWGDLIVDFNPGGTIDGVRVTPVINNGNQALAPVTLGTGEVLRNTYLVEVTGGSGQFSRNCGLWIEGACQACDTQRPLFYLWEPSFLWKNVSIGRRATDWEDLGYKGSKFIQGVVLRANTFGQPKTIEVQFDGPLATPQVALTLSALHNGEQAIAYPVEDSGWNPFIAELVRLQGADDVEWILHDWRFIYEPAPEIATQWETQSTTFDCPGFLTVFDAVMAYSADADLTLTIWHDLNSIDYVLPATGGEYQRIHQIFNAAKGKAVAFAVYSELPFRLYKRDCSVRIQGWGIPGGYRIVNPFGGPHMVDGAGV